ncbi:SLC13 family permease [Desulfovibrio sp. UCD-KL4C]|uniref:SLC13 family permease n=1 Tax=Desulfovibrio sp. UCD-KL4C TaxID=2578120 RepID=UPI0025BF35AF|nr:SLC13 family permease [Desulfovibrio sp. UCD-KL4C]
MSDKKQINISEMIHLFIGLGIMCFGRMLPAPSMVVETSKRLISMGFPQVDGGTLITITPVGMTVVTLFIGVVYLWTTVDTMWPSFLGVLMLGMSDYAPMPMVLKQFMGNPMVVMIFFLFVFAAILVKSDLSTYLARWFMTHPKVQGRPWMFTASILLATYFVAFLEQVTACFLMLPVLFIVFKAVGFKKGDRYVTFMVTNVIIMALLSFASDPIKAGAFYLLANLQNLAVTAPELGAVPINLATYLVFAFTISFICIGVILFLMRFVFRVDVSPLQNIDMNAINKDKLPPLSGAQKTIIGLFIFYAIWLLLPGIIGRTNQLGAFLGQNALAGTMIVTFLACLIRINGKPVADLQETGKCFSWRTFFLIATAFLLGGAMSGKGTNVSIFMEYMLRGHLSGMGMTMLSVTVIIFAIFITNFFNSVVAGLVLSPVLLAIANAFGFNAAPVIVCFFYVVLIAAATPAGSPFGAILFDQPEWISKKDAAIHAIIMSAVVVIVMIVVGVPLANVLF